MDKLSYGKFEEIKEVRESSCKQESEDEREEFKKIAYRAVKMSDVLIPDRDSGKLKIQLEVAKLLGTKQEC